MTLRRRLRLWLCRYVGHRWTLATDRPVPNPFRVCVRCGVYAP